MTLPDGMTTQGLPSHVLIYTTLVVGKVLKFNNTNINMNTVLRKALHIGKVLYLHTMGHGLRPPEPPELKD